MCGAKNRGPVQRPQPALPPSPRPGSCCRAGLQTRPGPRGSWFLEPRPVFPSASSLLGPILLTSAQLCLSSGPLVLAAQPRGRPLSRLELQGEGSRCSLSLSPPHPRLPARFPRPPPAPGQVPGAGVEWGTGRVPKRHFPWTRIEVGKLARIL